MVESSALVSPLEGMTLELKPWQFTAHGKHQMLSLEQVAKQDGLWCCSNNPLWKFHWTILEKFAR